MNKIDAKQKREIKTLGEMNEQDINLADIPESTTWANAEVGKFFRPVKKQLTLRIDMDVVDWFQSQGSKYQTRMNLALREFMESHKKAG